jgi:hypothetical protein
VFKLQWCDNTKARIIDQEHRNEYRKAEGEKVQSQVDTYQYFKKLVYNDK